MSVAKNASGKLRRELVKHTLAVLLYKSGTNLLDDNIGLIGRQMGKNSNLQVIERVVFGIVEISIIGIGEAIVKSCPMNDSKTRRVELMEFLDESGRDFWENINRRMGKALAPKGTIPNKVNKRIICKRIRIAGLIKPMMIIISQRLGMGDEWIYFAAHKEIRR